VLSVSVPSPVAVPVPRLAVIGENESSKLAASAPGPPVSWSL
jgi:hypothetical protein